MHEHHSFVDSFQYVYVSHSTFYDKIADSLEDSYLNKFQINGKAMFSLFLDRDPDGKHDGILLIFHLVIICHFWLLIGNFVVIVGLNLHN